MGERQPQMCVRAAKMRSARNVSPQILSRSQHIRLGFCGRSVAKFVSACARTHAHRTPELCLSLSLSAVLVGCIFTLERRVGVLFALRWRWRPWPLSKANGEIWTNFAKEYSPPRVEVYLCWSTILS
jgi:hypothetical protein